MNRAPACIHGLNHLTPAAAALVCVTLQIKWCVINQGFPINKINQNGPVQFFLYAVSELHTNACCLAMPYPTTRAFNSTCCGQDNRAGIMGCPVCAPVCAPETVFHAHMSQTLDAHLTHCAATSLCFLTLSCCSHCCCCDP